MNYFLRPFGATSTPLRTRREIFDRKKASSSQRISTPELSNIAMEDPEMYRLEVGSLYFLIFFITQLFEFDNN